MRKHVLPDLHGREDEDDCEDRQKHGVRNEAEQLAADEA
jgi:hypothetical protein